MSRREALLAKLRTVAAERAGRARAALAADDSDGLEIAERELHTLKGEAQLLGRRELAAVAAAAERLLARGEDGEARTLLSEGLELLEELAGSDDEGAAGGAFAAKVDAALARG